MRILKAVSVSLLFCIAACGQAAAPTDAEAQTGALSDADHAALFQAAQFTVNTQGQIENACNDWVTPQVRSIELGGEVGAAHLIVVPGGPNALTCYGDGPGLLILMRRTENGFRQIYMAQGSYLVVMPSTHNGVNEIVAAGPGFEHPLWQWNGNEFTRANRRVPDSETTAGTVFP